MKIKRLDYVLFSHQHSDLTHGALKEGGIFDHFEIGQVYWNGIYNANWKVVSMENICQEKNIPLQILRKGDTLDFGQVQAEVLWPLENMAGTTIEEETELNNNSIVIRLDYKDHSSLFTGDLYKQGEANMVEANADKLDVELLKVPRHGQNTSSSLFFAGAVMPKLAVATGYHTIIAKTIETYENTGATFLDDQYHGYIHVASDGTELTYDTDHSRGDEK